jgi:hypothetical protein
MRCFILCIFTGVCSGFGGCALGSIGTQTQLWHHQYLVGEQCFRRVIKAHPEFRKLDINEHSAGFAVLGGELPSEGARQELRRILIQQAGEEWVDQRLNISVVESASAARATNPH